MENIIEKIKNLKDGETLEIPEGRYFVNDTIELSGKKNITIKGNGNVIFDGGITLKNEDVKDYDGRIKYIDLKPYGIKLGEYGNRGFRRSYINSPNELFVNGEAYSVARYPKNSMIHYGKDDIVDSGSNVKKEEYDQRCAVLRLNDERFSKWTEEKDAYLGGYPAYTWADDCIKIKEFNKENKTVTTNEPHLFSFQYGECSGWYIVNVFSELTDEGEYYIDRENEKLYFIPKGEIKTMQLSVLDKVMIALENCENVRIEGITFENSRNSGVYIEGGNGVVISDCIFHNLGILGVQIGQGAEPQPHGLNTCHGERAEGVPIPNPISREMGSWHEYLYEFAAWDNNGGKNHSVENCKIYDTGAGGILLSGGNRKKLIPANNRVYNCEIYNVNRLDKTYKAGINMMGVGNTVSHCEIYNLSGMAIYMHGNDHIIEFNKIHDVVKEVSDSGAIYMGRDMSEVGNVFRSNYIYDLKNANDTMGVCAIYFDDWDIFNEVYDNFFYNISGGGFCVIHHTCGGYLSFHNNFVIDCVPGIQPDNKSNAYIRMHKEPLAMVRVHTKDENDMHGVDITSEAYKNKYPYLYDVYKNDARPEWMYYNNQILYKNYKIFKDGKNRDFTLIDDYGKSGRDEFDWMRRTDVVAGYENELVMWHKVDFKSIGLIK